MKKERKKKESYQVEKKGMGEKSMKHLTRDGDGHRRGSPMRGYIVDKKKEKMEGKREMKIKKHNIMQDESTRYL